MSEFFGVTGKILRLDMTREKAEVLEPGLDVYKKHVGGIGMAMYYLFKEGVVSSKVKPFDPENLMHIMAGPLNGVVPGTQSVAVTKAPHNFIAVSYSGGHAIGEIKFAGWDGVQVYGRAKDLLWVSVVDDKVEFHDAKDLKGKLTDETEMLLKGRVKSPLEYREKRVLTKENLPIGKDAQGRSVSMWDYWGVRPSPKYAIGEKMLSKTWSIGPAGEKGVWHANIMTEGSHAHGRYGTGAILGSKNLKAITIRGTKGHKLYDKAKVIELIKGVLTEQKKQTRWRTYGTANVPASANNYEDAYPIRNFQYLAWHDPRAVSGFTGAFLDEVSWVRHQSCCSVGCQICFKMSRVTSDDPAMDKTITDMPDWEAQGNVGGLMDFIVAEDVFPGKTPADPYFGDHWNKTEAAHRLLYITNMFDELGMDYIEGGVHISLLMELRQRGLITKEDLLLPADVGDLTWGNHKAAAWVLKQIATSDADVYKEIRKGTWETAKYFANKKGKPEILQYAQCTKRYGQPAHDPRSGRCKKPDEYIQTERPCAHTEGYGDVVPFRAAVGSLVGCTFALAPLGAGAGLAKLVEAVTGWTFPEADLNALGERVYTLERTFNIVTQEITDPAAQWDSLWPKRWLDPLPTGWARGTTTVTTDVVKAGLEKFYAARGMDAKGFPTAETMKKHGIEYADEYLKKYRG